MKRPSLKGPELKMPEVKAPAFLADLYYDLRDRRLLPLVALVVVAIAAVPFLLGGDAEQPTLPAPGVAALESSPEKTSKLTVVEATPGLRDYRKRLRGRVATDPFEQQYTEPAGGSVSSSSAGDETSSPSGAVSEESVTTEGTAVEGEEAGGGSSNGGSSNGPGGSPPGSVQTEVPLYEFVLDVHISRSEATANGGRQMGDPEVRRHVRSWTQLPGRKTPVVTSMSINLHNGKVVWLVSNDVQSLEGEFDCVARTSNGTCERLEIEPGFPLELVYGPDEVLYRIKVTDIDAVRAGNVGDQSSSRADFALPGGTVASTP
jgi:hypothetical protein